MVYYQSSIRTMALIISPSNPAMACGIFSWPSSRNSAFHSYQHPKPGNEPNQDHVTSILWRKHLLSDPATLVSIWNQYQQISTLEANQNSPECRSSPVRDDSSFGSRHQGLPSSCISPKKGRGPIDVKPRPQSRLFHRKRTLPPISTPEDDSKEHFPSLRKSKPLTLLQSDVKMSRSRKRSIHSSNVAPKVSEAKSWIRKADGPSPPKKARPGGKSLAARKLEWSRSDYSTNRDAISVLPTMLNMPSEPLDLSSKLIEDETQNFNPKRLGAEARETIHFSPQKRSTRFDYKQSIDGTLISGLGNIQPNVINLQVKSKTLSYHPVPKESRENVFTHGYERQQGQTADTLGHLASMTQGSTFGANVTKLMRQINGSETEMFNKLYALVEFNRKHLFSALFGHEVTFSAMESYYLFRHHMVETVLGSPLSDRSVVARSISADLSDVNKWFDQTSMICAHLDTWG